MRSAAESAQGQANAVFENFQVGRALAGEGVLLHPCPESLVGVEFGSIGGEAIDAQARIVLGQRGLSLSRAVGIQTIPKQEDRARNPVQQVTDEFDDVRAGDGSAHQAKVGAGAGRDDRDGGQLGPVEAVIEQRGLASRGPGLARGGEKREPALIEKDQRGLQLLGFFLSGAKCA